MLLQNKPFKNLINLTLILFCSITLHSQNNESNSIHDWFDSKIGKENLSINNGKLLLNYDRVFENNDRFYFKNYVSGSVLYEGQIYNNITLNYDIFKDDLIIKPMGENDKTPIILPKEKVQSFTYEQKKYVNLNYSESKNPEFVSGFYEEGFVGNFVSFYVKHYKTRTERIYNDKPYDDFTEKMSFVVLYKNEFYSISSKKSIVSIFPEYKKSINEFYSNNDYLIKIDKVRFFSNLFSFLTSLSGK